MTKKSTSSVYIVIAIVGLFLVFLAYKYKTQIDKESAAQYEALRTRINKPRNRIDVKADPVTKKIEEAQARAEEALKSDNVSRRKQQLSRVQKERAAFLNRHNISFPADPMATLIVKQNEMMEIGKSGSYTLGIYILASQSVSGIKNSILKKLNVPSDELKPVSFSPNASNGFRNQSLYEVEAQGLYHMFFIATHPRNGRVMVMHFTIQGMSRVVEQYINKRYQQLRAS